MWRTVEYYLRVVYNVFRLPIKSLLAGGRIRFKIVQKLSPFARVSVGRKGKISFGKRCMVEAGTYLRCGCGLLSLGDKVFINRNCMIVCNEGISIGEKTTIGPNVCIYDHDHNTSHWKEFVKSPIRVGRNVWIGANVVILKGVSIGNNCVIGAGTIVTKDIPDNMICYSERNNIVKFQGPENE